MTATRAPCLALAFLAPLALLQVSGCESAPPASDLDGAVRATRAFGDPCSSSLECLSDVCVATAGMAAVCSSGCRSDADCPAAINWGCVSSPEIADRVCGCIPDADVELCGDRRDNDCDGDVDDCRLCGGAFVAADDRAHCGACFVSCRDDEICDDGACVCSTAGAIACGGICVDSRTDERNCGACGVVCADGEICSEGLCGCSASRPTACDGECVDTGSDARHCGSCDRACPVGQVCTAGACGCADGDRDDLCPLVGCVDLESDEAHCGSCATACDGSEVCSDRACICPTDGHLLCGGTCRDVRSDPARCGGCDNVCPSGSVCRDGACACDSRLVCGGACVAIGDPANCGACGRECRGDQVCASGTCRCSTGLDCGSRCVDPNSDATNCGGCGVACGPGQACTGGVCGCAIAGQTYCAVASSCRDLQADRDHCGACGNACPAAQSCSFGRCVCPSGLTYCAATGTCVDLQSDRASCGACGNACPAAQTCSSGRCACPTSGWSYCASVGTCVDVSASDSHCGACDAVCAAGTTCQFGSCRCGTAGETYCTAARACAALATDPANCGSCGRACAAGATCSSGTCRCSTGQVVCGTACVDTATSASHCGACGAICAAPRTCSAGACSCPPPSSGTAVRITATIGESYRVRVASDGTRVAVVWSDETSGLGAMFQLLSAEGAPVTPALRLTGAASVPPDIAWNGLEWAVVWAEDSRIHPYPSHPMLQRIASDGTPIGAVVNLAPSFAGSGGDADDVRIVSAPGAGFFLGVRSYSSGFVLALGAGTAPFGIATSISSGYPLEMAVAPDGRVGVLLGEDGLQVVNADGSITTPRVTYGPLAVPRLAHDGVTWAVVGVNQRSTPYRLQLNRGPTLSTTLVVHTPLVRDAGNISFASAGDRSGTITWMDVTDFTFPGEAPAPILVARVALPSVGAPTVLMRRTQLIADPTADHESPPDMTHVGARRFVVAWPDTRWGQREVYALASEHAACP